MWCTSISDVVLPVSTARREFVNDEGPGALVLDLLIPAKAMTKQIPASARSVPTRLRWLVSALVAVSAACVLAFPVRAEAPEGLPVDPGVSSWFESLRVPAGPKAGGGCCSWADCRAVQFKGHGTTYQAFIKKGTRRDRDAFSDGDDQWHTVPEESILRRSDNPVGEAVACWYNRQILCFVLPPLT